MAKQGIKIKNKGLFLIGIILLIIGVALSLYKKDLGMNDGVMQTAYPDQILGIILVVAGLVLMVLGFFYSPRYLITAFQRKRIQQSS
jgi:drug/metabolite transporter (DMT)-like permease